MPANSDKICAKAIRRNFEKIIQNVDSDDVLTYLYQEEAISTVEYQTVLAEAAGERKVNYLISRPDVMI